GDEQQDQGRRTSHDRYLAPRCLGGLSAAGQGPIPRTGDEKIPRTGVSDGDRPRLTSKRTTERGGSMPKMRAAQVVSAKGPYQIVEREIPEPGAGQVRIRVQASGVCHSDAVTKEGYFPGIEYPRVPGHEVAGIIDAIGAGVAGWKVRDRVGVGWHGGHCGHC